VQKNFKEKYFEQGLEALEAQRDQAKRGQLADDLKMLTYAASGFAFAMQNNPAEAKANYRRILPLWGNWRSAVKTLERLEKDEAAGKKRVALALDCVGEAPWRAKFLARATSRRARGPGAARDPADGRCDLAVDPRTLSYPRAGGAAWGDRVAAGPRVVPGAANRLPAGRVSRI
jgi:hypothetical protein